jgi:hypothetical protein
MTNRIFGVPLAAALMLTAACGDKQFSGPSATPVVHPLQLLGLGADTMRWNAEIAIRGTTAFTTTWAGLPRHAPGNRVSIWDVSGNVPLLLDSLIVPGVTTLGDVQISDDGAIMVVATETRGGGIVVYDIADPRHPKQLTRYQTANTDPGVHTAKLGRVNGRLYGFLSIDPAGSTPARLVIVDLSLPSAPREVFTRVIGNPYVHDVFVRDGILFVALWNDGVDIWDIGGGAKGGIPEAPIVLGNVKTIGGQVHNVWWYHDVAGEKRFAFVGQEAPGSIGSSSAGDIHVIDVSNFAAPKEVAFYHVAGAGTHNFSVDEKNGVLYAAYYNGGVRAIDVRGDLGTCSATQKDATARCDLTAMGREIGAGLVELNRGVYVWGVQYLNGFVYASDMLAGIYKLTAAK